MDTPSSRPCSPLERKPSAEPEGPVQAWSPSATSDPQVASSIAGRLARLDKHLTKDDREMLAGLAGGTDLGTIAHGIVDGARPRPADRRGRRLQAGPEHDEAAVAADCGGHAHRGAGTAGRRTRICATRSSTSASPTSRRSTRCPRTRCSFAGHSAEAREKAAAMVSLVQGVHRGAQGRHPRAAGALQPPVQGAADVRGDQGTGHGDRAPAAPVDTGEALARLRDAGSSRRFAAQAAGC